MKFVANRIGFIRSNSSKEQWKCVPRDLNPTGLISGGVTIKKNLQTKERENGPKFLWENEDKWPKQKIQVTIENTDKKIK